jgi:hypothetical protein
MREVRVERRNGYSNETGCVVFIASGTQCRAHSYPMQRPINTTHTNTHTSSHETRGNQRVVLPPAKPPSLLLTAPPRSLTNPYPNQPATSPPPPQTPPPPCGMPAAVCLKEALCARRKTHSCTAEPSSNVYIVTPTPTATPSHTHS